MGLTQGTNTEAFQAVRDALEQSFADDLDLGASVAVHHRGEVVVDIWGGYRDAEKLHPWTSDTLVNVWSSTKTMTFISALLLMDRGELDFDAPVATYWPEFAAGNKKDVKVRHVLSHSAGLSGWAEPLAPEDLADWDRCTSALANQEPWWEPGTQSGYHAVTQGYLLGEIIHRITGQRFAKFFQQEFADPLDADFHIGLAEKDEERVSLVVPSPPPDFSGVDHNSVMYRTFMSPPLDASMPHNRWWRAAEIPAANGHGNARSVARVQSILVNGGEANGRRYLKRSTIERIFETETDGMDLVLGIPMRFGAGYGLNSETVPIGPRTCFWAGFGGSIIMMDLEAELTVSYMMNLMRVGLVGDTRGIMLAVIAAMCAGEQ